MAFFFPAWVRFLVPLSVRGARNWARRSLERNICTTRVKSYECHGSVSTAKMRSCSTIFVDSNVRGGAKMRVSRLKTASTTASLGVKAKTMSSR